MTDPVAFLGFSSFKAALTKPIERVGGFPPLQIALLQDLELLF